jgi:predicted secreted Zn-dependent protease
MADPAPPVIGDVLDYAWDVAQRLAIEVIEYPADKRDQVMRCMGNLLAEVARHDGRPHEVAREFGVAMEQVIRGYVSEIEASGGGTGGTA